MWFRWAEESWNRCDGLCVGHAHVLDGDEDVVKGRLAVRVEGAVGGRGGGGWWGIEGSVGKLREKRKFPCRHINASHNEGGGPRGRN